MATEGTRKGLRVHYNASSPNATRAPQTQLWHSYVESNHRDIPERTMTPCRAKRSPASDRRNAPFMAQHLALHGSMVHLKSSSSEFLYTTDDINYDCNNYSMTSKIMSIKTVRDIQRRKSRQITMVDYSFLANS